MNITCALFVLALASYANAQVTNCKGENSPGSCLDPDQATGCQASPGTCTKCMQIITLSSWLATSVMRICALACTAVPATSSGVTICDATGTTISSIKDKGPLECYQCSAGAACTAAQTGNTPKVGGWTAANGCTECWIKATFTSGTLGDVVRGCTTPTPAPTSSYSPSTATGDIVDTCSNAAFCNSGAAATAIVQPVTLKCQGDGTPGSGLCLNPAAATGCATAVTCDSTGSPATPQCKSVVTLENWIAKSVVRTCVQAGTGAAGCTPTDATTATGTQTVCESGLTADVTNKGPLKCYVCTTCTAAQTPGTNEVGGWTAAAGCKECWIKANFASGTLGAVDRGCSTNVAAAPAQNYNAATRSGDVVTKCSDAALCNSGAGSTLQPTTTTASAATTPAPGAPGGPAAATTTAVAGTTTAVAGGGSGASTIAPATFTIFRIAVIIMMFG